LERGWKPVYQPHFWTAATGRIQKVYYDAQKRLVLIEHSHTHTHTHTHTHISPLSPCCMLRPREAPVIPLLARSVWGLNRVGHLPPYGTPQGGPDMVIQVREEYNGVTDGLSEELIV